MDTLSNIMGLLVRPSEQPIADTTPSAKQDRTGIRLLAQDYLSKDSNGIVKVPLKQEPEDMTEKTINATLDKVGVIEGGYVNNPNDRGGETNHGVTLRFLQSVQPGATSADLKGLTKDKARKLFDEHFVRRPGFDQLPDVVQAEAVALGINAGIPRAIKVLQKAAGVKQDGHLGPETLAAVKGLSNEEIKQAVDQYYIDLVERNPSQRQFLKGWLNRSASISSIPEDMESDPVEVYKGDDGKLYVETPDGLKEYNGGD